MIISTKEIYQNEIKHSEKSQLSIKAKKIPKKKLSSNNGTLMDSGKVKCVEGHQRSNPSYFFENEKACKWGRKEGNVNTCGDCPFGIQVLEIKPAHNEYLENWEAKLIQWTWPKEYLKNISPLIQSNKIEE